jgi:hypothetical protein
VAITARNPRRARLAVTLAGIALTLTGIPVWGVGDMNSTTADQKMINNSAGFWGPAVGFHSGQEDEYHAAAAEKDAAETQANFGIGLIVLGAVLVGSRWLIKPTPAGTPGTPAGQAAATLTPEQQEQAIAMYLDAQKRQQNTDEK